MDRTQQYSQKICPCDKKLRKRRKRERETAFLTSCAITIDGEKGFKRGREREKAAVLLLLQPRTDYGQEEKEGGQFFRSYDNAHAADGGRESLTYNRRRKVGKG